MSAPRSTNVTGGSSDETGDVSQALMLDAAKSAEMKAALSAVFDVMGPDERRVILLLARRLLTGQAAYGRVNLAEDRRDWRHERSQEIQDLLIYSAFETLKVDSQPKEIADASCEADRSPPGDDLLGVRGGTEAGASGEEEPTLSRADRGRLLDGVAR